MIEHCLIDSSVDWVLKEIFVNGEILYICKNVSIAPNGHVHQGAIETCPLVR